MIFQTIKTVAKACCTWVAKHSPEILTVVGTGGVVTSVVLAAKAAPRAKQHIEEKKKELNKEKLTFKETIKACGKDYAPTAVSTIATISCFLGVQFIHANRHAYLASMCSLAEQGMLAKEKELSALKEEMTKNLGEEKSKEIQEKVREEQKADIQIKSGKKYLFKFAGQFFEATPQKIWKIENTINRKLHGGLNMYMSLNDILDEFELEHDKLFGEDMFITVDDGCEFRFSEVGTTEDGELYISLAMEVPPHAL